MGAARVDPYVERHPAMFQKILDAGQFARLDAGPDSHASRAPNLILKSLLGPETGGDTEKHEEAARMRIHDAIRLRIPLAATIHIPEFDLVDRSGDDAFTQTPS